MPQKTLKGEYKRLLELDERIGQLETELRARPDITQELGEALKDVAERILPPQIRVRIANQIEAATGVRLQETDGFLDWSEGGRFIPQKQADSFDYKTGEPVVIEAYHGTNRGGDFEEFQIGPAGAIWGGNSQRASDYAAIYHKGDYGQGARVYPLYMKMKNPFVIDAKGQSFENIDGKSIEAYARQAKADGHDGIIVRNVIDKGAIGGEEVGNSYAVFERTQVKSINNRGTFDPNDPRILYQAGDNAPRAKSTSDSLTGTHIEAPEELFNWLGVKKGKFQANYTKLAGKRAEQASYDPLSEPGAMRDHVESVLTNAAFALKHKGGMWNLIGLDGQGKLLSVDIEVKGNQYEVITAHAMSKTQIEDKIRGAFKEHGEGGFKWKVDPRRSISGVPQEAPGFVTRSSVKSPLSEVDPRRSGVGIPQEEFVNLTGVKDPLSVDDYINHVRQIQAYQERGAHPSAFAKDASGNIHGAFDGVEDLIQIARSALDPEATLRHESVHALRALNLFKNEEWALLEQSAKEFDWIRKHNIASRYDGVLDGDDAVRQQGMLEEAIAEEFSKWRAGELEVTPQVKTIFERIQEALKRIVEVLRANGIESYEDVFKLVDEGEIAGRAKAQKQNELAQLENEYAAVKGNIERLEQGSLVPPEITPGELQQMIDLVGNGKRPKKPESLFQFLQKQGGLLDEDKALLNLGLTPKTHPELVRSASDAINEPAFSMADKINKGQPLSLEDAGFLAWNEGFFPDRPSTKAFLKAMRDELQGEESVRFKDLKQQRKHQDFVAVEEELNRLGINPKDPNVRFARTPFEEDVVSATARVLDDKADEQIAKLEQKIAETKIEHDQDIFPLELDLNAHVDEVVNGLFKKLTGRGNVEDFVNDNIIDYGFLKGRTFGIRDELIEEFLEDDIEHIMRRYTRNVAGQIEMKKRFGNLHLKNHFEAISDEFNGLRQEVHYSDKSPKQKQKEINKLEKQEADAIRDLQFARDKVLGRYEQDLDSSGWARTVDAALSWQYMTSLGGVLVTSLSDAWRTPMVQGFGHVFGKQLPALIAGNKGIKINRDLARKYAGIAEIINNSRLAHMAGLNDPFSVSTPTEIAIQKMTDRFSKLTGLPYWNQFWKEFAGTVIIDRALDNMIKGIDNLSAKEVRWLRSLGLGDMATGAKQLQAEGAIEKVQGLWTINPDKMPGPLMDLFFAGVKKEIDTTIVSKGIGDAPLFAETKLGRIATQFKSFGAASNQRMLIRGMQDDLGNFTAGMAGMITTGMFIYMLKQLEAGREIDDNPGTWLAEGIDRSGMFFLFFEANNIVEKIGRPGVYQALDAKAPASRFASRNAVGALAGPLFGSATDLFTVLGQGARAINPGAEVDLSPGDVKATRRLAPYATLPYWRWMVDGYIVPTMQDEVR